MVGVRVYGLRRPASPAAGPTVRRSVPSSRVVPISSVPNCLPAGPAVLLAFLLILASPAAAQFPAELAGQVLDQTTKKPLEGARVRVPVAGRIVETDVAGRFRLKGLPAGDWEVEVTFIGYRALRSRVTLTDGQVERITVVLDPNPILLAPIEARALAPATGAGVSVIDRAALDRAHAPDLPALLEGQPGVTIIRQGGAGSPASVSIRGSAAHQVLVLLDGVPLNDPTTGEVDLASLPLEQLERVTIIRGAAAARYGARALAGVIAIDRRHPTSAEAQLTLAAGSWGERTARGGVTAIHQAGRHTVAGSLSGALTRFTGDFGYAVPAVRGGGSARRVNDDGGTNSLLGAARFGGASGLTELRGDYLDVNRGLPGSIVQPSPSARQHERRLGTGLSTRQVLGGVELRGDLDLSQRTVHYADPAPPASPAYDDSLRVRQLQATLEGGHAFRGFRASLGTEGRWLGIRASNLTVGAPTTQRVLSTWLEVSAEPALGRLRPTLTGGARLDHDGGSHDTRVSPSLGLSLPVPGATVQLSWAMAFAPAALTDQFFQPGVLAQPNPNLEPERVRNDWQMQLTSNTLRLGRVTANGSVSLFRADVDGMILWFPNFRFIWSPANYDVRRRGTEISAAVNLPVADLSLAGSVSDVAVEYRGPVLSGQVAYRPRTTATASLGAGTLGFRTTLAWRYIGQRRTVAGSGLNTLAPFAVTNLELTRRIPVPRVSLDLAVGVDDVFDRAAGMLVDYPTPGRTWRLTLSLRARGSSVTELPLTRE